MKNSSTATNTPRTFIISIGTRRVVRTYKAARPKTKENTLVTEVQMEKRTKRQGISSMISTTDSPVAVLLDDRGKNRCILYI